MDKIKVLVVDDAEFMRDLIKKELINYGCQIVGEAANGKEAIELYKSLSPDIVTMDIKMPIMDGVEAIKEIKKVNTSAIILVISDSFEENLAQYKFIYSLKKPFQPAYLWRKVDTIIEENDFSKKEEIIDDFSFVIEKKEDLDEIENEVKEGITEENIFIIKNNNEILEEEDNEIAENIIIPTKKNEGIKEEEKKTEEENNIEISIRPPRGKFYNQIKENMNKPRDIPQKVEPPILNHVESDEDSIEKKETFVEKIKNLLKK